MKVRDIETIQKMLDKDTQNINLYIEAARFLIKQNNYSLANKYVEDACEIDCNNRELIVLIKSFPGKLEE